MRKISMKKKSKTSDSSDETPDPQIHSDEENDTSMEAEPAEPERSPKKSKKSKKGSKKSLNSSETNGSQAAAAPAEEDYEVEKIMDQKNVKGVRHFLIRWKGYGEESDTWEPENTVDCHELIDEFLKNSKNHRKSKGSKRGSKSPEKSPKKAKHSHDDDEGESSKKGEYEVDRIIEVHHKKSGKREFLVHWKGYSSAENTWEPEENMNCPDLIEKFMAKVDKAKHSDSRELRVNRKPTNPFTLSMEQSGRRLSRRNLGKQRAQYHDAD